MSKKIIIKQRLERPEKFSGQKFKGKSMTVPGQAITPQEIIRSMTTGVLPKQVYHQENLTSFQRMDKMEQIDHLRDLAERNTAMKDNIMHRINQIQAKVALEKQQQEREQIRAQIRAELMASKDQDKT